ncbi:serpin family protein [Sphingomonas sp.]|uniref:serpin family protein n=1 Tax=Sphingomonas sp. TaxID=28214 RepID=UPI00286DF1C8|nr:serpin family protein [Sphingomonas sp.]
MPTTIGQSTFASGVALYREVAAEESGNLALSPVSLTGALAPVAAGARGETRAAIGRAMGFGAGDVLAPTGAMLRSLAEKRAGGRVDIANALWLAHDLTPNPEFVAAARSELDAEVATLDFRQGAAAARRINAWAKANTEGRVPHVIDPPFDATRLVITNAVYLLADWADQFDATATRAADFFAPGKTVQAPLMHRIGDYRMVDDGDAQILDLPYADGRMSLSLVLPRKRDGLAALERRLSGDDLARRLAALDSAPLRPVEVRIPKAEFSGSFSLNGPLMAMGMGIAFTDQADLSGIANEPLAISRVLQSTFLKLDEKGTEAAAVTAVDIMVTGAMSFEGPQFRADHPFLFVLRDRPTGALLFIGRVADPTAR